jgi:2-oxoglutarate dehydrogenase E2 component (dihydrolipoamide succinyltransferase)
MFNIVVPQLGESVVEARVARWLKKEGDRVEMGEPVVELETEKIDLEVGTERSGVISSIKRREGEDVKVGELLATVDDTAAAALPRPATSGNGSEAASTASPQAAASPGGPPPTQESQSGETRATPSARRLAKERDVDLTALQGSGTAGRVTRQDVESALAKAATPPAERSAAPTREEPVVPTPQKGVAQETPAVIAPKSSRDRSSERSEERVRMSKRRLTIARRLVEAQHNAAMLTTFNEVDMTAILSLRERYKETFKTRYGVGIGIVSFFVKVGIAALRAFPRLNAEIQGEEIVLKHYWDIGIAVGAEGGLVVPVLRDADRMSFAEIELAIRDFAKRAQDGNLTLEDLKGGTFTITNGGVFGSLLSTPILNPPQVGILGLHKIEERPVAVSGQVIVRPMMYIALSYDHRIVDGREAVQFLARIKDFIEDPGHLLINT